jgi:hypothetical protein
VWDQPLFSELTSSKRRPKPPGTVTNDFGVAWRVELVEIGSCNSNLSLAENAVPQWLCFNHQIVELLVEISKPGAENQ